MNLFSKDQYKHGYLSLRPQWPRLYGSHLNLNFIRECLGIKKICPKILPFTKRTNNLQRKESTPVSLTGEILALYHVGDAVS